VGELRAFTQQHADRDQPIVVYCAHAQCGWATNLSRRLVALGYRDIKVYEPGLVGYYTEETM
jgi:rhodanese-related sulfurtransferase